MLVLLLWQSWPIDADQLPPIERGRRTFEEWFGSATSKRAAETHVNVRWWSTGQDVSAERGIIIRAAREYWSVIARSDPVFAEGLTRYSASRVINDTLDDRNLATYRFFGGFVPFTLDSVSLWRRRRDSRPIVRRFPEFANTPRWWTTSWVATADETDRWADVLYTLERSAGWPAIQQALSEFVKRHAAGTGTAAGFAAIVGEQRGSNLDWLDLQAASPSRAVDYLVEGVTSTAAGAPSYETVVRVRREGAAVVTVPVTTEFADGSSVRDSFDAANERLEFRYRSRAPAIRVSIDPDAVLLIDADRTNNVVALRRRLSIAGAQVTSHWLIWLQDLLLTWTALA